MWLIIFFLAEAVRIEAQIKAAETASRVRAEAELKMQREREREAARLALQKVYIFSHYIFLFTLGCDGINDVDIEMKRSKDPNCHELLGPFAFSVKTLSKCP